MIKFITITLACTFLSLVVSGTKGSRIEVIELSKEKSENEKFNLEYVCKLKTSFKRKRSHRSEFEEETLAFHWDEEKRKIVVSIFSTKRCTRDVFRAVLVSLKTKKTDPRGKPTQFKLKLKDTGVKNRYIE